MDWIRYIIILTQWQIKLALITGQLLRWPLQPYTLAIRFWALFVLTER